MDCRIFAVFLLLLIIVRPSYEMFKTTIDEENVNRMYNCLHVVVCIEKKPEEFLPALNVSTPKTREKAINWISEIYHVPKKDTIEEFMTNWAKESCPKPLEQRVEYMRSFGMEGMNYYEEICGKRPEPYECQKYQEAIHEIEEVIRRNEMSGVCNKPEEGKKQATNIFG